MELAKAIQRAYDTQWSYVNSFTVHLMFSAAAKAFIGWTEQDARDINLNIISIDTPQFSNSPIEVYTGDRWKIHNGREDMYRFTMTFRDQDQLDLYKKFVAAYLFQKHSYFDDAKMQITLMKDADYVGETTKTLFDFSDVFIESVSKIQFSNTTEAQIAEFSVDFKTPTPEISLQFAQKQKK